MGLSKKLADGTELCRWDWIVAAAVVMVMVAAFFVGVFLGSTS